MSTKYLGGENILRATYDPASESLRTTAVASFAGGTVDVTISHLTDSIKIGDGVDLLAVNPDGSINVNATIDSVANPLITNISLSTPGTEYSFTINSNTKRYILQSRNKSIIKLAYISGQSGITYLSIGASVNYSEDSLKLTSPLTIYAQSDVANTVIELLQWS